MQIPKVIQRSPVVFALALLAAVALLFISEGSYRRSVGIQTKLHAITEAQSSIHTLQRGILAAETAQRGYLLTDRREYMPRFGTAREEVAASVSHLERYYADDPKSTELLGRLSRLTTAKLAELAAAIRLYEAGERAASTDIVLSDLNKRQMDDIRTLSSALLQHETLGLAAGRDQLFDALILMRIGVAALGAAMLLALYLYLRYGTTLEAHRDELKRVAEVERERLEIEVRLRTAQLTELTQHLLTAREDERHRLARDLHDELGALLTSAKLDAARIKSRLAGAAPEALERLAHLVDTLNSSIALGRRIIEDLRPSTLANLGLVATLEILARDFAERSGVEVQCTMAPVALSASAELVVYRLVQEAITNLSKYAKAQHMWLSLGEHEGRVVVSVRDDGVGFDTSVPSDSAYGLLGMRYRVEAEGGTLAVVSAPGQGTLLRLTLPASTAVPAPA